MILKNELLIGLLQPEKITEFFDAFVRGRADLFPVLEDCLEELGILIGTNETENTVFNALGIQVNAQQVIQKIHPESIASHALDGKRPPTQSRSQGRFPALGS